MGVGVKIFDSSGNLVTDTRDFAFRQRAGEKFTFKSDPFPVGTGDLNVVLGGGRIGSGQRRRKTGPITNTFDQNRITRPKTLAEPITVPKVSGTRTRREIQLSESKKGDLFCEIKIIKGKRKRVCKVKTTDKKRKKPIRATRSVNKQFGFFGRIL